MSGPYPVILTASSREEWNEDFKEKKYFIVISAEFRALSHVIHKRECTAWEAETSAGFDQAVTDSLKEVFA